MKIAGALAVIGFGSLASLFACSALVSSELENVRCLNDGYIGPPACPAGTSCRGGTCTPCLAQEVCDNQIDDNCDSRVDENCSGIGGAGGITSGGGGSPPLGGNGGGSGSGGASGGASGGGTGGVAPGSLGAPCTGPGQCDPSLFCADPTDHGGTPGEFVCTKSCCNSNECSPWTEGVCFGAKGGYDICLPASRVGRPTPGAKDTGDSCGTGVECRSAVCANSVCQDTCCSDSNCPGNLSSCAYQAMLGSGWQTFTCANKSGANYGEFCGLDDSACKSDVCSGLCSKPCCRVSDCGGVFQKCWYSIYPTSGDVVKSCMDAVSPGTLDNGQPCVNDTDCKSSICVKPASSTAFCSDACCKSSDCGNPSAFSCLPATTTTGDTLLICWPK